MRTSRRIFYYEYLIGSKQKNGIVFFIFINYSSPINTSLLFMYISYSSFVIMKSNRRKGIPDPFLHWWLFTLNYSDLKDICRLYCMSLWPTNVDMKMAIDCLFPQFPFHFSLHLRRSHVHRWFKLMSRVYADIEIVI